MAYRFRPDPNDPDYSYFDLYFLRPSQPGVTPPPPPDPIMLDVKDSYTLAEGLGFLAPYTIKIQTIWQLKPVGLKPVRKAGRR